MKIKECKKCINNEINPSIHIEKNGVCNICNNYEKKFNKKILNDEIEFIKNYISKEKIDCLVGLSGGKDSTAMLKGVLDLGFHPMAFSFQGGYNNLTQEAINKIKNITKKINIKYEVIDVRKYVSNIDKISFKKMADIYDRVDNNITKEEFRKIYSEGRKYYSVKDNIIFPFIRPCQICRKIVIKAYYEEAISKGVKIVFVGINEWASLSSGYYSAIRKLKPYKDKPEILIVHLPFLLQTKYEDIIPILESMKCKEFVLETKVETGGNSCLLAKACEKRAKEMLGFHLDSARLSREITVGFIKKEIAKKALEHGERDFEISVRKVLENAKILNQQGEENGVFKII